MIIYKKLSKIDINNLSFGCLVFELLTFFLTKNYISVEIIITHVIIIISILFFFIANIDLLNIKKKIANLKYLFSFLFFLILLYLNKINYSVHLNQAKTCKQINLILGNFIDCSYTVICSLIIFALFFLIFYLNKLKINLTKVFIIIGLIFIIIAFYNLIIYYLGYLGMIKTNYFFNIIPFRGDYGTYFQYLPFAIEGKRNDEIIIFILAYTCCFYLFLSKEKNKSPSLIYILFITSFLTFSKNLWLDIIIITLCLLIYFPKKKYKIITILCKSIIFLTLTILIIYLIQIKIDTFTLKDQNPKKHFISVIDYTLIKFNFKYNNETKSIFKLKDQLNSQSKNIKHKEINNNYDANYYFNSTPQRKIIYKTIINKLNINNIFLGSGVNSINFEIINTDRQNEILYITNAESGIVQILFEIGVVGLFIYLIFFLNLMKIITKEGKIIFLSLLFLSIFNSYQENTLYWILLGSILGSSARIKIK